MGRVGRTVSSINQAVKYVEASQPGEARQGLVSNTSEASIMRFAKKLTMISRPLPRSITRKIRNEASKHGELVAG